MSSRAPSPPKSATRVRPRSKLRGVSKHGLLPHGRPHQTTWNFNTVDTSRPSSPSIHLVTRPWFARLQYCAGSRLIYNLGDPVISSVVYVYGIVSVLPDSNVRENRFRLRLLRGL